jgi:hypothetical protein
MEKKRSGMGDT